VTRQAPGRLLAALGALWAPLVFAQDAFPAHPLRLVVSFTPGGGADFTARTVAQKMSEPLGQQVVVENKPGANGILGISAVMASAPDGYTLLETDRGALSVNPSLYKKLPYDPAKDFEYLGVVTSAPYVLVSDARLPAKTLAEFVALAKSKPGSMNYASFGIASMAHLNGESLKSRLGVNLIHVPYKGAGPAIQAVVAGESALSMASPPAVTGFVRDGRLRALAIGADRRSPLLPEVPTMAELGAGGDTLAPTYFAFALPAKTPRGIVDRLQEAMKSAVNAPDTAERLKAAGLDPVGGTGAELLELVKRDIPRFRKIIQDIGIQPE
jgi:tripartite-type tricarboxylate transporter receptor subunit TctC